MMIKVKLDQLPPDKALAVIAKQVKACQRCRLAQTRTQAVPGHGSPRAKVMFIGEGPGFNEDQQGIPFCGRAGALLDQALQSINWRRQDVFITNVVKCRPPQNRDPEVDEIAACSLYLNHQIKVIKPVVVATLGRFSMAKFLPNVKISQVHGQVFPVKWMSLKFVVVPLYHPAAALRNGRLRSVFMEEFAKLPGIVKLALQGFWDQEDQPANQTNQPAAQAAPDQPRLW